MTGILIPETALPKERNIKLCITPEGEAEIFDADWGLINRVSIREIPSPEDLIDRRAVIERFARLSEVYDLALRDCDLEKEVYPHYEALMRGKKAVVDMAIKILEEAPTC